MRQLRVCIHQFCSRGCSQARGFHSAKLTNKSGRREHQRTQSLVRSYGNAKDDDLELWKQWLATDDPGGDIILEEASASDSDSNAPVHLERNVRSAPSDISGRGGRATCRGCGVGLQTADPATLGFVSPDVFEERRRHKQLDRVLCTRCQALKQGEMIPAVSLFSEKQERLASHSVTTVAAQEAPQSDEEQYQFKGQRLLTPMQLRDQLKRAIVVMMVDILDVNGSFLNRCRDLIGKNPGIVIASKLDLLPKGTVTGDVEDWLYQFIANKQFNCLASHVVSNKTGLGVDAACASILSHRQGRDVYMIGAANVGKSAFVSRMMKEMSQVASRHFDQAALPLQRSLPTESAMPGTTLGLVRLAAFTSGGALFDTPGLHFHHRMPHILSPEELKAIHPKRRLRPYIAASAYMVAEENDVLDASKDVRPCATYHWGALMRIDVLNVPVDTQLVFFGTGVVQVLACALMSEDELVDLDPDADSSELEQAELAMFGAKSVAEHGGLRVARHVDLMVDKTERVLGDIAMSGLPGWLSIVSGQHTGQLKMRIWTPRGVESYLRPPLPCPCPISFSKMPLL